MVRSKGVQGSQGAQAAWHREQRGVTGKQSANGGLGWEGGATYRGGQKVLWGSPNGKASIQGDPGQDAVQLGASMPP